MSAAAKKAALERIKDSARSKYKEFALSGKLGTKAKEAAKKDEKEEK